MSTMQDPTLFFLSHVFILKGGTPSVGSSRKGHTHPNRRKTQTLVAMETPVATPKLRRLRGRDSKVLTVVERC